MMRSIFFTRLSSAVLFATGVSALPVAAQTPPLIYQGQLTQNGAPAHDTYDLQFALFDAPDRGEPVGEPVVLEAVKIVRGLFTVSLPFDPRGFEGRPLWLEIWVRLSDTGDPFTLLTPRQPVGASPESMHSLVADNAATAGRASSAAHADSAAQADTANSAATADQAQTANEASHAARADTATFADNAGHADLADTAGQLAAQPVPAEAVRLRATSTERSYLPPSGMAFVIEHVAFCDYWATQWVTMRVPMSFTLQHASGAAGTARETTMSFESAFTTLERPLMVPAGAAIRLDNRNDSLFECDLYGELVPLTDVEAVIVPLFGESGSNRHIPPTGKVFMLQHVLFGNYWQNTGTPETLILQHSLSAVGTARQTTLAFQNAFNTLPGPLGAHGNMALSIENFNNNLFSCYLYGVLKDLPPG